MRNGRRGGAAKGSMRSSKNLWSSRLLPTASTSSSPCRHKVDPASDDICAALCHLPMMDGRIPTSRDGTDPPVAPSGVRGLLARLGPGLVTGAADDDPSGIGTHSQVGAQFGYGLAWTFTLTFPLM